ncbi:MAG: hypothetical protein ACOC7W_04895 [Desulfosalsimonas sp.]
MTDSENRPECFGVLELVFPMTENGLRQTPEVCMECDQKTDCLKTAIKGGGGLRVEDEKVDRAYQAGNLSFLQRWAKKKSIHLRRHRKNAAAGKS